MLVDQEGMSSAIERPLTEPITSAVSQSVLFGRGMPMFLCAADLFVLLGSYVATLLSVQAYTFDLGNPGRARLLEWCLVLGAVWVPLAVNHGLYKRLVFADTFRSMYTVAKCTVIAGALFHLVPLVGGPVYSRVASLTVVLAFVGVMTIWRGLLSRIVTAVPLKPIDLVVVGADWEGRTLAEALATHPQAHMRIVAFTDVNPELVGKYQNGILVHPLSALAGLVQALPSNPRIVLSMPDEAHAAVYDELTAMAQAGVEVLSMASVYEQITGRIPVRHLGNFWWAMLPRPSTDVVYLGCKRVIDIALALAGLLLLALLLPFVALLSQVESPGPIFFSQRRVGRFGKPLTILKLRTLAASSSDYTNYWERKRSNSPARVGAILRLTGIDELPQCWRVLLGDMSIVGPRPYVPDEVADFQQQIPFFRCRALVKPGLTGWAQVNWGYGLSLEDEIEKLQYDLYYVGHQSFYMDLRIVLRTAALALRRKRPTNRGELLAPRAEKATA